MRFYDDSGVLIPDGACLIKTTSHPAKLQIPFMRTMRPTPFLPAGFQLAAILLLAIVAVRLY